MAGPNEDKRARSQVDRSKCSSPFPLESRKRPALKGRIKRLKAWRLANTSRLLAKPDFASRLMRSIKSIATKKAVGWQSDNSARCESA